MEGSCELEDSFEQYYSNQSESSSESTPTYNYPQTTTNSISINLSIYNTSKFTSSTNLRFHQYPPQRSYQHIVHTQIINYESDSDNSQEVSNPASVVDQQQPEEIFTLNHLSDSLEQQSFVADQNRQSPFFNTVEKQGMSQMQILNLPSMRWSQSHQLFNHGEKCSVCFEPYQIGQLLRVIQCFHRFHAFCVDPWLAVKSSCPNCRTLCQEVNH